MNRFGSVIRQAAFLAGEEDRRRMLAEYLDSLSPEDRDAVCLFLTAPAATRRIQLKALRRRVEEHVAPELFQLSHAFTGDLAETIALLWPNTARANRPVAPAELLQGLRQTGPLDLPQRLSSWLSGCDVPGRHAIVRIATGTLRNPVPATTLEPLLAARGITRRPMACDRYQPAQADLFGLPQAPIPQPGEIDAVLLYVEQGRTHPPTVLCTFGAWQGNQLVPVARLDAGPFSEEIRTFASRHTGRRFGPTREVSHAAGTSMIATIAYDAFEPAARRRAGFLLKAPRILALSPGASPDDAGDIDALTSLLPSPRANGY